MSDAISGDDPVILFDGVCNLCNGFVQFLLPRDTDGIFRFASLQSEVGKELLADHGLPTDKLESIVLIEGDDHYVKSGAVIRIAQLLGGVYGLLGPFRYLPRAIRDRAYDFVAARRYRWFGKKDQCAMPPADVDVNARFLE
ncbi:thiol-disulfide oxidoreductase DCC family protein [Natrinema marinum]|uniref:thiol-disulfide oxidoreductase DCC family protein n=1 Tax=Natrinema marinum TaxID=2961598 RepID=UPI0020C9029F|nr:thiol-disulfide oxidoreductase DCC family protein [Natrinema marinum]